MSQRAVEFVDNWIAENIHAEGYPPEGDDSEARGLATMCEAAAQQAGISKAEIDEDLIDLVEYMSQALENVNDAEVERLAAKDD